MEQENASERLILHFHGLGPVPAWVDSEERDYWCPSDRFVSMLDAIQSLSNEIPIEITFDDGNASDANIALPALTARGLRASFFICAGRIGKQGYLDRAGILDIVASGMEVGSHGWGHVNWRRADDKALDAEIDEAPKLISDIVGYTVNTVAIPFGSYDRRVLRRLRRSQINTVLTSDGGRAQLTGWMFPREVFRVSWDDRRTLAEMATKPLSVKAGLRRSVVGLIKRMR